MDSDRLSHRVRLTTRRRTMPLPMPYPVWTISDAGHVEGPVNCLALVVREETWSCDAPVEWADGGVVRIAETAAQEGIRRDRQVLETLPLEPHFLLATDGAPLRAVEDVFFTEAAAEAAAEVREPRASAARDDEGGCSCLTC